MNIGRMIEFARILLGLEEIERIQKRLANVSTRIQNVIDSPQDLQQQQNALAAVSEVCEALGRVADELSEPIRDFLIETGGDLYFMPAMGRLVEDKVSSSGILPAVAKQFVDELQQKRHKYLESLREADKHLRALRFEEYTLPPGTAEVGFKIPRSLFENKPGNLAGELKFIDFTVSTFTEAVTGEKVEGEIAQLATSDPVIVIQTLAEAVLMIAWSTKILVGAYSEYLANLAIKQQLRLLEMSADAQKELDDKSRKKLDKAIEQAVERVLKKKSVGRSNEVANALRASMKGLIARIERGLKIEVRFIAAPKQEAVDEAVAAAEAKADEEFRRVQRELTFPQIPETPLLEIPKWPQRSKAAPAKKAAKSRGGRKKKAEVEAFEADALADEGHSTDDAAA